MRKIYCDACGKEIKDRSYPFSFLIHLESPLGYYRTTIDGEWLPTSGREENKDLCLKCYNRIYGAAWNEFKTIKEG